MFVCLCLWWFLFISIFVSFLVFLFSLVSISVQLFIFRLEFRDIKILLPILAQQVNPEIWNIFKFQICTFSYNKYNVQKI